MIRTHSEARFGPLSWGKRSLPSRLLRTSASNPGVSFAFFDHLAPGALLVYQRDRDSLRSVTVGGATLAGLSSLLLDHPALSP